MRTLFNDDWYFKKFVLGSGELTEPKDKKLFEPDDFYEQCSTAATGCFSKEGSLVKIEIPHDYLIYDTKNLYQDSVGYYKKDFDISLDCEKRQSLQKSLWLRFEGVYQNWACYVNGKKAIEWKYGYSTVEAEITPYLVNGKNTVEVVCVYQSPNTRWYSGAGIFRDVYLIETGKVRIASNGVYFSATKNNADWDICIETEIESYSDKIENISVKHEILDSANKQITLNNIEESFSKTGKNILHIFKAKAQNVKTWDIENPNVYKLKTAVFGGESGKTFDKIEQNIGFRSIFATSRDGFFLNGKRIVLHGVCEHHDFGSLGSAFSKTSLLRKFKKLRSMGVNAIRSSHNPPAPYLLDLADELGFLIIDECFDMWEKPKTEFDYGNYFNEWSEKDCTAWVKRDRNHPCVIMWSIGNEIYDTHQGNGLEITKRLSAIVRKHDAKKNAFITIASNYMYSPNAQKCADEIDFVGYNYGERFYEEHHEKYPDWIIYGSETASCIQSRGIYHFPLSNRLLTYPDGQCSSLGNCSASWGAKDAVTVAKQDSVTPYTLGQFLWSGFDYIGEPTPYKTKNSYFGQIDTAGFEKDTFFAYKAAWVSKEKEPFVHLLPYWDFNEGQLIDIRAYTNCTSVELFVNGVSAGEVKSDITAVWEKVPYKKGSILAIAKDENGKEVAREEKHSFSDAESLSVTTEDISIENFAFENDENIHFIDICALDKDGYEVSNSNRLIKITTGEDTEILGVDNGNSTDFEQYKSKNPHYVERRLFSNRLLVIVRGKAEIKAELVKEEIPIRKIELITSKPLNFSKQNQTIEVEAIIYPENASENCKKSISWQAMMIEGVESDCVKISTEKTVRGEKAIITAQSDGDFRLTCTAKNGGEFVEVISELEANVSGFGKTSLNPYQLIQACKCTASQFPLQLSFEGGAVTKDGGDYYYFDRLDFGTNGSDTLTVPIFSFDTELDFSVYEGKFGTKDCKLLTVCHYSAPSIYNTYTPRTFTLPRRLFGKKSLSFTFDKRLYFQGFSFEESAKAFARLSALDADAITGDSFTKTEFAVEKIGNNVSLDFSAMDFDKNKASKITICGYAHGNNTINLIFASESTTSRATIEFASSEGYVERTFDVSGLTGLCSVSFIFLPGSNFDFKYFQFA